MQRDAAPVWCHPRRREEDLRAYASLDGGRHPTEARTVGPNPRRAAGSPVVSSWLRLFSCAKVKTMMKTSKKLFPTLDIGSHSNAQAEARATEYRPTPAKKCTLWPVASSAVILIEAPSPADHRGML